MNIAKREKIVLLGMMGRMRVAGAVWQALHYLVGFQRLGYEVYYVEAHGCLPWAFGTDESGAASFIAAMMERAELGHSWSFHVPTGSGTYYGMTGAQVRALYDSAALIINLHGGTVPTDEQSRTGRLVYIDTDPVSVQIEIANNLQSTIDILDRHALLFTFAENYGQPDCRLPVSERFHFKTTRQPVVLDFWQHQFPGSGIFTTIGNWQQLRRAVDYEGEEYLWSKHLEFMKFIDLPSRSRQVFELALSSCDEAARQLLREHRWLYRDGFELSREIDSYREYIQRSRAEFTVAKDQNIRMRTGWFSDRSATYLASGRPVITQDTAFGSVLPLGQGLFAFNSAEDILRAVDSINRDYPRACCAASEIARDYFAHEVVLGSLLSESGIGSRRIRQVAPGRRAETGGETLVNLIGNFSEPTGLGMVARRYIPALREAGVALRTFDVSGAGEQKPADPGEAEINLICCDIAAYFAVRDRLGEAFFRDRYNVGIWFWELAAFPYEWQDRFAYFDEIWTPSSFIASGLSPISPLPVVHLPVVLKPDFQGSRQQGRARLGIDDEDFTFAFIFNFHSKVQRKNPLAAVQAFIAAFDPAERARLIIKCANGNADRGALRELQRRASGSRIDICDGLWTQPEVADLVAACDAYVSLHRAEGLGLTISDAMAIGKPAIATGWSGNMEFMNAGNSFPVPYRLVELQQDIASYAAGNIWADPIHEDAAQLMRYVFEHRELAAYRGQVARREIETAYSSHAVGAKIRRRLEVITQRNGFEQLQRRLREPLDDEDALQRDFSQLGSYFPIRRLRYTALKRRIHDIVRDYVPPSQTILVVSRGDDELLRFADRRARHFPQDPSGNYAGHHPDNSDAAIRHLEEIRASGGDLLLFPSTAFWWLDHYPDFREYLVTRYRLAYSDDSCRMFDLSPQRSADLSAAGV